MTRGAPSAACLGVDEERPAEVIDMRDVQVRRAGPADTTATVAAASQGDRYRRWVVATTLGELAGFAIPAVVGTAVTVTGLPQALAVAAMVLAGTGEGAVLGWAQSRALRRDLPGLRAADWVRATAGGAALAWLIGMAPSNFHDTLAAWPPPLLLVVGLLAGAALLTTIGVAQWTVLRRHLARSAVWVGANALGWVAGLMVVFTAIGLAPDRPLAVAVAGVLGGLGMGLTVALITGAFLIHLLNRRSRS